MRELPQEDDPEQNQRTPIETAASGSPAQYAGHSPRKRAYQGADR